MFPFPDFVTDGEFLVPHPKVGEFTLVDEAYSSQKPGIFHLGFVGYSMIQLRFYMGDFYMSKC